MKQYAFLILILTLFPVATFAQEKIEKPLEKSAPVVRPAQSSDTPVKTDPLSIRKEKVGGELTATKERLEAVILRTQEALDLLKKNGKDTTTAQTALDSAKESLEKADQSISLFIGPKEDQAVAIASTLTKQTPKAPVVLPLKEQVKNIQENLKDARASLIESIKALRDTLDPQN